MTEQIDNIRNCDKMVNAKFMYNMQYMGNNFEKLASY